MAYSKQTWVDNNLSYPVSAARMGTIENGIEAAAIVADQGHLILTTTQRNALSSPSAGTTIYNSTTTQVETWNGSSWAPQTPTGVVSQYAGLTAPSGWLLCAGTSGTAVTQSAYPALWSILTNNGATYPYGGSGTTTYTPDLRGRVVAGKDDMGGTASSRLTSGVSGITGTTLGASGGDQSMQSHFHWYYRVTTSGGSVNASGDIIWAVSGGNVVQQNTGYLRTDTTGTGTGTGSSQNVQPTLVLNYIIKT